MDPPGKRFPLPFGDPRKTRGRLPPPAGVVEEVPLAGSQNGGLAPAGGGEEGVFPLHDDVADHLVLLEQLLHQLHPETAVAEIRVSGDGKGGLKDVAVVLRAAAEDGEAVGGDGGVETQKVLGRGDCLLDELAVQSALDVLGRRCLLFKQPPCFSFRTISLPVPSPCD